MNVNIENTSELRRKMTIELELEEINRELDKTYNELRRGVQVKGFRPGRAPRNMLERMFGDQVRTDVVQKLIKEYTGKALEELELQRGLRSQARTHGQGLPGPQGSQGPDRSDGAGGRRGTRTYPPAPCEPQEGRGAQHGAERGFRARRVRGLRGRQADSGYKGGRPPGQCFEADAGAWAR